MEHTFQGKTALITGAGSGIGRAIALKFSGYGIRPLLVGRKKDRLEETKGLIAKQGGEAFVLAGDITNTEFIYDGEIKYPEFSYDLKTGIDENAFTFRFENDVFPKEEGEYNFAIIIDNPNFEGQTQGTLKIQKPFLC